MVYSLCYKIYYLKQIILRMSVRRLELLDTITYAGQIVKIVGPGLSDASRVGLVEDRCPVCSTGTTSSKRNVHSIG